MKKLYEDLLCEMPIGWQNAFGMDLCIDVENALKKDDLYDTACVLQVKEKFGSLAIYITPTSEAVDAVLNKYARLSKRTCIRCGAPATRVTLGWITPVCDECIAKDKRIQHDTVPIGEFWTDIARENMRGG